MGSSTTVKFCLMFQRGNGFIFLSITENGFCRVKIREIFVPNLISPKNSSLLCSHICKRCFARERSPTYFWNTSFSRCKTCFGNTFKSALGPIAQKDFNGCVSTHSNALSHWNTSHPKTPKSLMNTIHSAL